MDSLNDGGKLVRDQIPVVMDSDDRPYEMRMLDGDERRRALLMKLREEAEELIGASTDESRLEEAADVLEVVRALAEDQGSDLDAVMARAESKRHERGGFGKSIWMTIPRHRDLLPAPPDPGVRILSWNVLQGASRRVERCAAAIATVEPTVVVLSEITKRTIEEWRTSLAAHGYAEQEDTTPKLVSEDPYALLVASRLPLARVRWTTSPTMASRALAVDVAGIRLVGIHAPFRDPDGESFFRWLKAEAGEPAESDALIIGDFNSCEIEGYVLREHFKTLLDGGWTHGLRLDDPNARHPSWWSHLGNGFELDHCLLSKSLASRLQFIRIVDAIDGTPTAGPALRVSRGEALSDHRPLLVDLAGS